MNDSPVGCQSRLTEAASSRKKEPYRPHQAKPELVARLEITSNGVIFLCIRNFAQIPIIGARRAPACMPSVTAAPCQTFGVPLACLPYSERQASCPQGGSSWSGCFRLGNKPRPCNVEEEDNCACIAVLQERTCVLCRKKKKSEPIPNRDEVRISWVWWSIGDSNS